MSPSLFALLALTAVVSSFGAPARTFILSIGLDRVNPDSDAYLGWTGESDSCVRDAEYYATLVKDGPYVAKSTLTNEHATCLAVKNVLKTYAQAAVAGDVVIIAYSGHGTQVSDGNHDEQLSHPGDNYDEAWCLYDDLLIDDELYALWSEFKAGVDIFVISDSCHAGTMTQDESMILHTWSNFLINQRLRRQQLEQQRVLGPVFGTPAAGQVVVPEDRGSSHQVGAAQPAKAGAVADQLGASADLSLLCTKAMPLAYAERMRQAKGAEYAAREAALPASVPNLPAAVFLFAACQDEQEAIAIKGHRSLYTSTFSAVWNDGAFQGNAVELSEAVRAALPPELRALHTPQYFLIGDRARDLASHRPFSNAR